ncbi:hypothetical protein RZR97_00790 [Hydrogenimonas thermophila]|uniref:hypothetical protein n=1 Tax=Hydrogenimonas thermophila TaxID=223786 RepID=UPI0029370F19|nr:hypothetical protein [Hydrogenimonas thermophila]WOE70132.1 hypothetical protein RZR91_00790 [Hydrogenimonas thermophila]WOE72649.1 hypothetical protein RZR97_00790 [Hydrogenimonas thermophila]
MKYSQKSIYDTPPAYMQHGDPYSFNSFSNNGSLFDKYKSNSNSAIAAANNGEYHKDGAFSMAGALMGAKVAGSVLAAGAAAAGGPAVALAVIGTAMGAGALMGLSGSKLISAENLTKIAKGVTSIAKKGVDSASKLLEPKMNNLNNIQQANVKANQTVNVKEQVQKFKKNKDVINKFNKAIKDVRSDFKKGKDVTKDIKELYEHRPPSRKSLKKLQNLAADNMIKRSAEQNNGVVDKKFIKQEYQKLGKELGWSESRVKDEISSVERRIEHHKDKLNIKENNKISGKFGEIINKAAQQKSKQNQFSFSTKEQKGLGKLQPSRQMENATFKAAQQQVQQTQQTVQQQKPQQQNVKEDLNQKSDKAAQQQPQQQVKTEAAKKFDQKVEAVQKSFESGKDVTQQIKDLHSFRIPKSADTQKLQQVTADHFIKQSAVQNKGFVNKDQIKQEYQQLAKDNNWSKSKLKEELNFVDKRIEQHKDNLNIKENGKMADFGPAQQNQMTKDQNQAKTEISAKMTDKQQTDNRTIDTHQMVAAANGNNQNQNQQDQDRSR